MNKIMFIDLETENNEYYGAIASPKHPDNYVVMIGQAIEDMDEPYSGEITYEYFENKEQASKWLHIPEDVWLVVAHNIPFETDWMYTQQYEELISFMNRGGMFWCTQLAEYRLSRQRELYPSLNDTCVRYGGNVKLDLVAEEWKNGKLTSEIDPELLRDYLIGFDSPDGFQEGDIGNTRLSFYGQYELMAERGMLDIFFAQMDGIMFNGICMSNGLKIDTEFAYEQLERLQLDSQETEAKLEAMRYNIPEEGRDQFNSGSLHHASAWLYGGAYKYRDREVTWNKDGSPKWEKLDSVKMVEPYGGSFYVSVVGIEVEDLEDYLATYSEGDGNMFIPAYPTRYKSGKNKGKIKVERIDSEVQATRWGEKVVEVEGLINFDNYPKEFIEDFERDYTTKLELADGSAVRSSSEEAIDKFLNHPNTPKEIKEMIGVLKHKYVLDKILGAFYLNHKYNSDGSIRATTGMLQYVTDTGFVHHTLNATATVTGRLSCTRPNLQQLPRDGFGGVKEMFVSRFGEKGRIVEIDYSNLEVITLANFSLDTNLVKQVRDNLNVHDINSSDKLGISYEEFVKIRNDSNHPLYNTYNELRDTLKGWEFQYQYGGTARGISFIQGCSIEEAEAFIEAKTRRHPEVSLYYDGVEAEIKDNAVNIREFRNDRWQISQEGMFKGIGGFEYSYKTYETAVWERGQKYMVQEFKYPQIRNYHLQGESSVFVQIGTGKVLRYLASKNFYDGNVIIVHTTHDSITLDIHEDYLYVIKEVSQIMEGVKEWMKPYGYDMVLDFPVEASIGMNMQDQEFYEVH